MLLSSAAREAADQENESLVLEEKLAGLENNLEYHKALVHRYEGDNQRLAEAIRYLKIEKETLTEQNKRLKAKAKSARGIETERDTLKEQLEVMKAEAQELFR
jgi:SMC interacting uncharacterized protein involved in chromosome segregation